MKSRLEQLAGSDPTRLGILKGRETRSKSRRRFHTCRACGATEAYGYLDDGDVCDACLEGMWGAQNVIAGEYKAGKKAGLIGVHLTNTSHWLPYPRLADDTRVPDDVEFGREDNHSYRVMQKLFCEIAGGLAQLSPSDPTSRRDSRCLIGGGSPVGDDVMHFRLTEALVKSIRDLWRFFEWHSHSTYFAGFERGRDLLRGLNDGTLTAEQMARDIARIIEGEREAQEKIIERAPRRS